MFVIDMPSNGLYFACYEAITNYLVENTGSDSKFFAGGVSGMAYWILGMPADVLKSRLKTSISTHFFNWDLI